MLAGDFSIVKSSDEKVEKHLDSGSISDFSNFIVDLQLTDLQMGRRRFTWYKSNGNAMSRLNLFLISAEMLHVLFTHI